MHYARPDFNDPSVFANPSQGTIFFSMPYLDDGTVKDYVKKQMYVLVGVNYNCILCEC